MAPTTRRGPNTPVNNTNPNNMTPESIQAMIDQALLRNSTNGDGSHSSHGDNRRNVQTARPCFYADFMKCQPLNFKGTEGVVGLTRWIEKMESVFNISGCAIENQVKFATCTLLGAALTWWNGQIRTLGPEAYAMTWEVLKKKMTDKYCPQGEIKKLEIELWNLKVKGNDVPAYTERFQELTLICTKFVANETEKVDKYISGLPDNIYGNVKSARPKTLDETIELANDLMDQKLRTYAERQSDNKDQNSHQREKRQSGQPELRLYYIIYTIFDESILPPSCREAFNEFQSFHLTRLFLLEATFLESLVVEPSSTPRRRRKQKRSQQQVHPTIIEEKPVVTMADTRTMAELLRAPTEGDVKAIVVPPILAEHFELKHSLLNDRCER
ncbi:reverse transcriptase domain-containing protein [Tanacetum coccineum]